MIFRWARDQLGTSEIELAKRLGKDPYEVLTEIAAKVSPYPTVYYFTRI